MDDLQPRLNRRTYVRLTAIRLWENLPLILLASFLFSLLCAPAFFLFILGFLFLAFIIAVLTIPPAWAALLALEAGIVREIKVNIGTMFRALPRFWVRGVKLGLVGSLPIIMALLTLPALSRPRAPAIVWVGLAADAMALLILAALYLYAFPLLVLHDVNVSTALRNALILASRHIVNTLGLLSLGILIVLAAVYVNSGVLFFFPAMWGVFVVNNCRLVVEEELGDETDGLR